jgi:hypothetical protein
MLPALPSILGQLHVAHGGVGDGFRVGEPVLPGLRAAVWPSAAECALAREAAAQVRISSSDQCCLSGVAAVRGHVRLEPCDHAGGTLNGGGILANAMSLLRIGEQHRLDAVETEGIVAAAVYSDPAHHRCSASVS